MSKVEMDGSYLEHLKEQDWKKLIEDLAIYAGVYYSHIPPNEREELIFQAIEKVFSGAQAWDIAKHPDLFNHLTWVLKSVAGNQTQLVYYKKRVASVKDDEDGIINPVELAPDARALPDEELIRKLRIEEIRNAIKGDEEAEFVFLAYEEGASKPADVSEMTGYDVKTVYNILKRIRRISLKLER